MSLFQKGIGFQNVAFAARPRSIVSVRTPLRQPRQPRRYKSSTNEQPPSHERTANEGSTGNTNTSTNPSQLNSSASAHQSASPTAAGAAGAATTPAGAGAVVHSRGFREIIKASALGRLGRWYTRAQERKPYTVQLWSSILIYLCGDLSAQLLFPEKPSAKEQAALKAASEVDGEKEKEQGFASSYDPWRTVRHLIVGAGSSIPSYNWFWFLHNNFNFASKFLSILTKVAVQQACFTPVFNTYFFSVHSLLGGATFEETWERLKKALPVSITNSVKLWPAVTAFSLLYVPPQFRNVFSGVIAVGWQTYLSWLNQKAKHEVELAEIAATESAMPGHSSSMDKKMISAAGTA